MCIGFLWNKNGSSQRQSDVPHIFLTLHLNYDVKDGKGAVLQLPGLLSTIRPTSQHSPHRILTAGHASWTMSDKGEDCVKFMVNLMHRH